MKIDDSNWLEWANSLVDRAQKAGATAAEVAVNLSVWREVSVRGGELEKAGSAQGRHVTMKAYVGKRSASMSFSLDKRADTDKVVEDLLIMANASPEDPFCGLADSSQLSQHKQQDFDQFDSQPLLSQEDLRSRADFMAAEVGSDLVVDTAGTSHGHWRDIYAASNGLHRDNWHSAISQGIVTIYEGKALTRDFASHFKVHLEDIEDPVITAHRAADRTRQARNPIRPPSGKYPVLFDERVSSTLIQHLLSVMSAQAIARRSSWLIDYDEAVLPKTWKLIETPFRSRMPTSSNHDAEGFEKREQALVKNGRPQMWISNLSSARQLELPSSGHATGSGVGRGAGVRSARLDGDEIAKEKLLKQMDEGLLVTGFIGATINPHTGDYSRGVNGFWVRNGEIAEPVNETTVAGNLKEMLPSMKLGDDADHERSTVVGSLLIEEMSIAGA